VATFHPCVVNDCLSEGIFHLFSVVTHHPYVSDTEHLVAATYQPSGATCCLYEAVTCHPYAVPCHPEVVICHLSLVICCPAAEKTWHLAAATAT
jgi:hypothetical protein